MTTKRPVRRKVLKGWAILHKSLKFIEDDVEDANGRLYIYEAKPRWYTGGRTVRCTITYTLPTNRKKK